MVAYNSKTIGLTLLCLSTLLMGSCFYGPKKPGSADQSLFKEIPAKHSGITFQNIIIDTIPIPDGADSAKRNLAWGVNDLM